LSKLINNVVESKSLRWKILKSMRRNLTAQRITGAGIMSLIKA